MQKHAAALLAAGLVLPLASAAADPILPPGMYPDGTNAQLPTARDNLGLGSAASTMFYAKNFAGCTWDSGHDVGACINSAATAANAAGGGTVIVPDGNFGLSTTVNLPNGVRVVGAGGANYGQCGTTLTWIGASSGVMATGGSDSAAHQTAGIGLSQMCIDGATLAGTAVKLRSVDWGWFQDLYISRVTANAWDIDAGATANVQTAFNIFPRTYADLTDASSVNANGWLIGPGASGGANTNRNYWLEPVVTYQNGTGFICGDMDSNEIVHAQIEPVGGGTGKSLDLQASSVSALYPCRSNRFSGMFGVNGTSTSAVTAETGTYPSVKNTLYLDQESGAPNPVVNGSASLYWSNNNGVLSGGWTMGSPLPAGSGGTGRTTLTAGGFVIGNGTAGFNTLNLIKYATGCTLANDGTSPNTVVDIAACLTAEDSGSIIMNQTSAYTKTTGAWAVGTGNGCLDTGTIANSTWYYLYQVERSDNGVVDYLCTKTFGAPTMPSGYDRKRYIGAIKTDASAHILAFSQVGNDFVWGATHQDVAADGALGTSSALETLASVPAGYKVEAHFRAEIYKTGSQPKVLLTSPDGLDSAVDSVTANQSIQSMLGTGTSGTFHMRTNTAQQIRAISDQASTGLWIVTIGWKDPLLNWTH